MTLEEQQLSMLLEDEARGLDISPSDYQRAVESYTAVGNWLEEGFQEAYPGSVAEPEVYPQGSMRLGTVVRPVKDGQEPCYDIDLVCELQADKLVMSPRAVKHQVGDRLKAHGTYADMLDDEGRRCWTLEYASRNDVDFHIDILPCVPATADTKAQLVAVGVPERCARGAVAITHASDRAAPRYECKCGTPKGYAEWFDVRNAAAFIRAQQDQKEVLLENNRRIYASVDDVPDQLVRTPLQRAVQVLKRHRDVRFKDDPEYRPISMIITTAAAQFYDGEADTFTAVRNIVSTLAAHAALLSDPNARLEEGVVEPRLITRLEDGTWYIPNPVNPEENFADRWHEEDHARARAFFRWVNWVKDDVLEPLAAEQSLSNARRMVNSAMGLAVPTVIVPRRGEASGRQAPAEIRISDPSRPWGD